MKRYEGKRIKITAERFVSKYGWTPAEAAELVKARHTEPVVRVFVQPDDGSAAYEYDLSNVWADETPAGFAWGRSIYGPSIGASALAWSIMADLARGENDDEDESVRDLYDVLALRFLEAFILPLEVEEPFSPEETAIRAWIDTEVEEP